jgi:hypothetical protein
VTLEVDPGFDDRDPFALEKFFLQGSVRLTNEDFAAFSDYAVPGDALAGRRRGHRAASTACASAETQSSSQRPIR